MTTTTTELDRAALQRERITNGVGFVAALDQSGGSTPRALAAYGIDAAAWTSEAEMFDLVHAMRTRLITSRAFASGGIIGAILTGVFSATALGGSGLGDGNDGIGAQVFAQLVGVVATVIYCAIVSWILLKIIDAVVGLRVDEDEESEGLDIASHDERGYIL